MSDVALVAAERYSSFTHISFEEAMKVVTGVEPPLPNTKSYLDTCIEAAFKEISEGR